MIRREAEVGEATHAERSQQWPEQQRAGDHERAMEKRFKIESREEGENVMTGQPLTAPEEQGREDGAQQKSGKQVGKESGGVFQAC